MTEAENFAPVPRYIAGGVLPENRGCIQGTMSDFGEPLYGDRLFYCRRCCLPETVEGIVFDEMGISAR